MELSDTETGRSDVRLYLFVVINKEFNSIKIHGINNVKII